MTRDTPDPQGGQVYKDANGEPTGLLMDNAGRFVRKFMPKVTPAQQVAGMKRVLALANSHGLTSAGDPSGSIEDGAMYRRLRDQGQLSVRIDFSYNIDPAEPLDKAETELRILPKPGSDGDGMFRADEIGETGLDGAELTALLEHDYPGKPGYRGLQKVPTTSSNASPRLSPNMAIAYAHTRSATPPSTRRSTRSSSPTRRRRLSSGAG